ncbi:hypothetical protein [Pararhizobium polonicum]|nr:hypothetical protein [Pararhizobium polonicum]
MLMCLSMVAIAVLIGAQGLGEEVVKSLQYAARSQGLLAGFAPLTCAIVLDRIVQGATEKSGQCLGSGPYSSNPVKLEKGLINRA